MKRFLFGALALLLATASFADEAAATRAFVKATRTEPELVVLLKKMPKGGDLHVHVSGAVYSDTMLDAAIAKVMTFDPATAKFGTDPTKVPAKDLLKNNEYLYRFLNTASMRGWTGMAQSGHDHFFDTFGIFGGALGAVVWNDALIEVIGRAKAEHLQYMELMTDVAPGTDVGAYFPCRPSTIWKLRSVCFGPAWKSSLPPPKGI